MIWMKTVAGTSLEQTQVVHAGVAHDALGVEVLQAEQRGGGERGRQPQPVELQLGGGRNAHAQRDQHQRRLHAARLPLAEQHPRQPRRPQRRRRLHCYDINIW